MVGEGTRGDVAGSNHRSRVEHDFRAKNAMTCDFGGAGGGLPC